MDRRQRKTRDAIFRAFGRLLEKKRFENITVQEIIDEADIGRSTFYAHFETKDDLLRSIVHRYFPPCFYRGASAGSRRGLFDRLQEHGTEAWPCFVPSSGK